MPRSKRRGPDVEEAQISAADVVQSTLQTAGAVWWLNGFGVSVDFLRGV